MSQTEAKWLGIDPQLFWEISGEDDQPGISRDDLSAWIAKQSGEESQEKMDDKFDLWMDHGRFDDGVIHYRNADSVLDGPGWDAGYGEASGHSIMEKLLGIRHDGTAFQGGIYR